MSHCHAIVVVSRSGSTLLVTSHGIEIKKALQSGEETFLQLGKLSINSDSGDIAPSIQGLPLSCGALRLWNGKWRSCYRSLGQTIVMIISPSNQNVYSSLNLLSKAVRVLTSDGKVHEVPAESVQRKFPEMYLALDALVASYGSLHSTPCVTEARCFLESVYNPSSQGAAYASKKAAQPSTFKPSYKVSRRTLASQAKQLGLMTFNSSPALSSVRPVPGFELEPKQQQLLNGEDSRALAAAESLKQLEEAALKEESAKKGEKGDPFEDIFGPITDAVIKPAASAMDAAAAAAKAAAIPTPARPLLRLKETWRGETEGGRLLHCGLDGVVTWAEDALKDPPCPVRFSLGAAAWADADVKEALAAAQRHSMATSLVPDDSGAMLADGASSRMSPLPILLRYHVPPSPRMVAPVLANVGMSTQPVKDTHLCALVGVRVLVNQLEHVAYKSMTVTLTLPVMLCEPARVAPGGASYDEAARKLTWSVPAASMIVPGGGGHALSAAFFVPVSESDELTTAAQTIVAEVLVEGAPGSTYTGTILHQSCQNSEPNTSGWNAYITACPDCFV
ncbi:hypothetical protein CEUSTIGMA_g5461.t1 [Chlamydomonas eustigma]|uniref:MHD domain-containing protein n=1 Tax=Chlamydomonas eustigma TaxID=1157962 RepID=A0A250X525_9CHLO|nr:hypothetical protein CEUSTIGMA_g5461.t1 [Chlamydomonas eustigma]|eukprot:GAX78019.1 hypothetical protein CEUSTIGMA_g5461.t1 [Chlamydomonas eustigma]